MGQITCKQFVESILPPNSARGNQAGWFFHETERKGHAWVRGTVLAALRELVDEKAAVCSGNRYRRIAPSSTPSHKPQPEKYLHAQYAVKED